MASKEKELTPQEMIKKVLEDYYPLNKSGGRVIQMDNDLFVNQRTADGGIFYSTAEGKPTKPSEEMLYKIYCSLYDSRYIAAQLVLDSKMMLAEWEKLQWHKEPEDVKSVDGTVIGKIGTAYKEKRRSNSTLAIIFISADGTWATLTCYTENNAQEEQVAADDLEVIAKSIAGQRETVVGGI